MFVGEPWNPPLLLFSVSPMRGVILVIIAGFVRIVGRDVLRLGTTRPRCQMNKLFQIISKRKTLLNISLHNITD